MIWLQKRIFVFVSMCLVTEIDWHTDRPFNKWQKHLYQFITLVHLVHRPWQESAVRGGGQHGQLPRITSLLFACSPSLLTRLVACISQVGVSLECGVWYWVLAGFFRQSQVLASSVTHHACSLFIPHLSARQLHPRVRWSSCWMGRIAFTAADYSQS